MGSQGGQWGQQDHRMGSDNGRIGTSTHHESLVPLFDLRAREVRVRYEELQVLFRQLLPAALIAHHEGLQQQQQHTVVSGSSHLLDLVQWSSTGSSTAVIYWL